MTSTDNRLVLAGVVSKAPEVRYSPAGIPLTRFTLEHHSRQLEAGMEREARCKIIIVAAGKEVGATAQGLSEGQSVRVSGFITRMDSRQGNAMIALHAQRIQPGEKISISE